MKVAIMGAGAVGCYFGALLARAGHDVCLIGRPQLVDAVKANGLHLESKTFDGFIPLTATTEANGVAEAEIVLLCVKSGDTEAAGRSIAPHLKPSAAVLCLQNGVDNAERLQSVIERAVIPTAVYVASEMAGAGHVRHHGRGELVIGRTKQSESVAAALSRSGIPTTISDNVAGALWVKLIVNCSYNALSAVSQLPYGKLIAVPGIPDVIRSIVKECTSVATALGIAIPQNIDEIALAIAAAMPNQYSSTAQDLARGKPTEIDHLNGYVVAMGKRTGVPTPLNLLLQTMVKLKEATSPRTADEDRFSP